MLKYIYILICTFLIANIAKAQTRDTVITYYQNTTESPKKVSTPDSADFVRLTYPDSLSKLYILREYYKTGSLKFVGMTDTQSETEGHSLIGACISFYPNGKKKYIANYVDGKKLGMQYLFRPDGHMYEIVKWVELSAFKNTKLLWECYDINNEQICKNGNGRVIIYNDDFTNAIFSGSVKNGYMDGKWDGSDVLEDTVRYSCNFKNGRFISGNGYDKIGNTYPFLNINESAIYNKRDNLFAFLGDLNKYLVIPKDSNGKKIKIDTVHISFIIEKNGHVAELTPIGNVNPLLKAALNNALAKCDVWIPSKYYGMPYRTWLVISLEAKDLTANEPSIKTIDVSGGIIGSLKANDDLFHQN